MIDKSEKKTLTARNKHHDILLFDLELDLDPIAVVKMVIYKQIHDEQVVSSG